MNVLAIGAHPDDVDLYAGGLVAALASAGVDVAMADLTAGELATRGTPDLRAEEAREAARILGVSGRECLRCRDYCPDQGNQLQISPHLHGLVS